MISQSYTRNKFLVLLPVFGSLLFIALYITAAAFYPGGSQADKQARGFSWVHNYWCNLLNDVAINGQPNRAKFIALAALVELCISITVFWLVLPAATGVGKLLGRLIRSAGILSMIFAVFLIGNFDHDLITNMASFFGLLAMAGGFVALWQAKRRWLFWFGLLNLLLVALNNFVYYSKGLLLYLPLIQKISFLLFLGWVCTVCIQLYQDQQT